VSGVTRDGRVYRIKLPQTEKALPAIIAGVVKKEAEIAEITFSKPTLDQVFLDVVGRSMRDEESSGGDSGWENIRMERAR
jgi:ABC-2 type transport system ATP-binding protein